MKENALDVLMYLFQNYMDGEYDADPDRESLQTELLEAGFPHLEIDKAFDWLDGLVTRQAQSDSPLNTPQSMRLYADVESERLDAQCRGFLYYLEHTGVINASVRELIVDRVMALESDEMDLENLKWVILMVLFNQPEHELAYEYIENVVFEPNLEQIH